MDYDGDGKVKSNANYDPTKQATTYLSPVVVFCRGRQDTTEESKIEKGEIICSEKR